MEKISNAAAMDGKANEDIKFVKSFMLALLAQKPQLSKEQSRDLARKTQLLKERKRKVNRLSAQRKRIREREHLNELSARFEALKKINSSLKQESLELQQALEVARKLPRSLCTQLPSTHPMAPSLNSLIAAVLNQQQIQQQQRRLLPVAPSLQLPSQIKALQANDGLNTLANLAVAESRGHPPVFALLGSTTSMQSNDGQTILQQHFARERAAKQPPL